ncbi:decarboxylase [Nocardia thailandica]
MSAPPPAVPARLAPEVAAFLADPAAVAEVVARFGTPVHVVFPRVFAANLAALRAVLAPRPHPHRICYAHKVNRSRAFVVEAAAAGIAVDVASVPELDSALAAGFGAERIEMTGPKGRPALRAAVAAGVCVNADNVWELDTLAELGAEAPVLLRVSGFPGSAASRFGIDLASARPAVDRVARHGLALAGFSFHLDTAATAERVRAAAHCLDLLEYAYAADLAPTVLDVGGGLRQVFTDADSYDAYLDALRAGLLGNGPGLGWGGAGFGLQVEAGAVRGLPVFHKYANQEPAATALTALLDSPLPGQGGRSLSQVLTDNQFELWLEPGKSLVDGAGITLARVEFVKHTADGVTLAHVDLSRDTVTAAGQEVLVDPILLGEGPGDPVGVHCAGRLCLERDLVTVRRVRLPRPPRAEDLIAFPNTAAYHMDLSAASASLHPTPARVAVTHHGTRYTVVADADHRPSEVR